MIKTTLYVLYKKSSDIPERHPNEDVKEELCAKQKRYNYYAAPGLSAFEVQKINIGPIYRLEEGHVVENANYYNDTIVTPSSIFDDMGQKNTVDCTVYYYGIRSYIYFFNFMKNKELAEKAAYYLEEADRSYETGAYFSFLIMAGAVLEAILDDFLSFSKKKTLGPKIEMAEETGILPETKPYFSTADDVIRKWKLIASARNMLHANNLITRDIREKATACRKALDITLKSIWPSN